MGLKGLQIKIKYISLVAGILFFLPFLADAFGISPPHVINDRLFPGAHYEQVISLSRTDPEKEMNCKIELDTRGFEKWISVDPGMDFVIKQGEQVKNITIKVDVPKDAKPGRNRGTIRVTIAPPTPEQGIINIVLGARLDVDLSVTSEKINEMLVKQVTIPDLEVGWKVMVNTKIENKGNTKIAPDKIALDVYDSSFNGLIGSSVVKSVDSVNPFETKVVPAYFKIPLAEGQYWGDVKVYNKGEVAWEEKALFTVKAKGTLPPQPKEPFWSIIKDIELWVWATAGTIVLLVIVGIFFALRRLSKKRK